MVSFAPIRSVLRNLATPAQPPVMSLAEALPALVPKVRPRFHYEALALRQVLACPLFQPLAGLFALSLVADFPEGELDVGPRELAAWGADFDILLQRARSNLLLRGDPDGFREVCPGLFRSTWRDGLDGSRVLLPGLLKRLSLQGDPVVVLANPDTLLVAGADDPAGLDRLLQAGLEFLQEDRQARNACPLRLRNFCWETWEAPAEHPAAPLLARIRRRRLLEEYSWQKNLLDGRNGCDSPVTVAPLELDRSPNGKVTSLTRWQQGVAEGWLPEADRVGLVGDQGCIWLSWAQARRHLGHLLEPLGMFPERYRFKGFPDLDTVARLASASEP
jgi:hypothetical protein